MRLKMILFTLIGFSLTAFADGQGQLRRLISENQSSLLQVRQTHGELELNLATYPNVEVETTLNSMQVTFSRNGVTENNCPARERLGSLREEALVYYSGGSVTLRKRNPHTGRPVLTNVFEIYDSVNCGDEINYLEETPSRVQVTISWQ